MANIVYTTSGTCSRQIEIDVEDGIVKSVRFNRRMFREYAGCGGSC